MSSGSGQRSGAYRISVIIPVYNGELYLSEALDSVFAQTLPPFEVIVVNDGSTDRSAEILDSYSDRISRIDQKNAGTAAARNRGVDESTGELLVFLDQDDFWVEDKLEKQANLLEATPSMQVVWGDAQQFISPELPSAFKERFRFQNCPVRGYLPSALLARRMAFEKVGRFDPQWRLGEWADWYARYARTELACGHVDGVVAYRRIHAGNKGVALADCRGEYITLLRENLKRRRVGRYEVFRSRQTGLL